MSVRIDSDLLPATHVARPDVTEWEFVVRWDVGRTAPNALKRLHWRPAKLLVERSRELGTQAWSEAGRPRAQGKVRLSYLVRRYRALDDDGALGGIKWIRDGICSGRLVPDDSRRWVETGRIEQETGARWRGSEHCIVYAEEIGERSER